jgi:hypothetical protein
MAQFLVAAIGSILISLAAASTSQLYDLVRD